MSVYKAKTTEREAREALLHAAQLLGFEGPGIYDELIYHGGGRELVETPAQYIEMLRQSIEVNSINRKGEDWHQVNHRVRFVGAECARCEGEPVSKNHSDLCDACSDAEQEPKVVMTLWKGKIKDLATADLSGGWKGPGNYEVSVEGLPRVIRCDSMCDLVAVMSESPGALVRFLSENVTLFEVLDGARDNAQEFDCRFDEEYLREYCTEAWDVFRVELTDEQIALVLRGNRIWAQVEHSGDAERLHDEVRAPLSAISVELFGRGQS